jgi:DNA-binding NarL/FixJ family response regulator
VITCLVVDDNPVVRAALRPLLDAEPDIDVVAEAADGHQAIERARRLRPTVTLLDHRMPVADGLSVIAEVARHSPVLVLTAAEDPGLVAPMLRGGARGYLVYGQFEPADLVRAVRAVAAGQSWLSPGAASVATSVVREAAACSRRREAVQERFGLSTREREILELVARGLSNAAIGRRLGVAEKTVRNHLHHAYAKLGAASRTEAVAVWQGRR